MGAILLLPSLMGVEIESLCACRASSLTPAVHCISLCGCGLTFRSPSSFKRILCRLTDFHFSFFFAVFVSSGLVGRPVNPISDWFAVPTEGWEGPEPAIHTEDLFHISFPSNVIYALVRLALSFEVFNCGLIRSCESPVELEE